jgi:hypothetical protein
VLLGRARFIVCGIKGIWPAIETRLVGVCEVVVEGSVMDIACE